MPAEKGHAHAPQPGRCAAHGGLMWSNAMRACITPDDVIRGGCEWQALDPEALNPEAVGLDERPPSETYLDSDGYVRVWIGSKWDLAELSTGQFSIFRKGNWRGNVGSLDLACRIVQDNEGFPNG